MPGNCNSETTDGGRGRNIMDIEKIRWYCTANKLRWTQHIFRRLIQRGISMSDVRNCVMTGEIIESYPDDYPDSSCLILGLSEEKKGMHIVCGIHEEELWLITAYYPDPEKWSDDFRMRKEGI